MFCMWMVLYISPPASRMGKIGGREREEEEKGVKDRIPKKISLPVSSGLIAK